MPNLHFIDFPTTVSSSSYIPSTFLVKCATSLATLAFLLLTITSEQTGQYIQLMTMIQKTAALQIHH